MKLKLNVSHVLLLILLIMIAYVILSRMNCSCNLIEGGDYGLDAAGMSVVNPDLMDTIPDTDQLLDTIPGREVPGPGPGSVNITEKELRDIENEIEYRKAAGFTLDVHPDKVHY